MDPADPFHLDHQLPRPMRKGYRAEREIGAGGMGRVLLARKTSSGRAVAIKRLTGEISDRRAARFLREAAVMAELRHPMIPRLLSHGTDDLGPYLVMQYIEGTSLEDLGAAGDEAGAVAALIRAAGALDALHERGLVHRDVKPANVMLDANGRVFLVDMGLVYDPTASRLSGTGTAAGTAGYVAPELLMERPATPASDWFAWGASLFQLREGRVPYSLPEVVRGAAGLDLPPPPFAALDPACAEAAVITACLARNPRDRPTSGVAISERLAGGPDPATGGDAGGPPVLILDDEDGEAAPPPGGPDVLYIGFDGN